MLTLHKAVQALFVASHDDLQGGEGSATVVYVNRVKEGVEMYLYH